MTACLGHGARVHHPEDEQQDDQDQEGGGQVLGLIHFMFGYQHSRFSAVQWNKRFIILTVKENNYFKRMITITWEYTRI